MYFPPCSCSIVVIISVSQTEDAGSIPVSCCPNAGGTNGVRAGVFALRSIPSLTIELSSRFTSANYNDVWSLDFLCKTQKAHKESMKTKEKRG